MPPDANSRKQAAEIAYRMANILSYRGKAEQAITLYRRAITLDPSYVPPYLELEALLRALGRGGECERLYQDAVASIPGEEVFAARLRDVLGASTCSDDVKGGASAQTKSGPDDAERRAHVLLYADCFGIGGAEQVNHAIAMGFRARGYRVTFAQPKAHNYLVQERIANGIPHIWLDEDDIYRGAADSPSLCSSVSGESVFRQARADIALFCDGCPASSLGAKQVARHLGVPSVSLVHCVTREWATFFARYLTTLRALYRSSRQVIAVSHDNLALLHECFGLPAELGTVIHNGVAATFFEPRNRRVRGAVRAELGIPDDVVVCLTVARMELVKGYQFLVKAIRELRRRPVGTRLHFVWIGSGSMEPRIRAMIDQIGAGHQISLISRTPSVQRYLDAADMFVLPSIFEGMPVSVMEAMAKSLPVMATAISGTSEELGTTGHLLPDPAVDDARTIASLVDVLERWALDEDLRHEIGAECRRRAERMFTRDRMVADHLRVVEELLGDGSMAALASKRAYKGARS